MVRTFGALLSLALFTSGCSGSSSTSAGPSDEPSDASDASARPANVLSPASLTAARVPFVATFDVAEDGVFALDFGDGQTTTVTASGCPGATSCKVTHTYEVAGVFDVGAVDVAENAVAGFSFVAAGGTQTTPVITAISPSHGPVGTTVALSGSGFIGLSGSVVVDGVDRFGNTKEFSNLIPTTDTSLSFDFPAGYAEPCTCPAGSSCECAYQSLAAGTHSVAVTTDKGTSNAVTFTVDP